MYSRVNKPVSNSASVIFSPQNLHDCAPQSASRLFRGVVRLVSSGACMALARLTVVLCGILLVTQTVYASDSPNNLRFMRVHGQANPPYGFLQFCKSFADECRTGTISSTRFNASPYKLIELDTINRRVNAAVSPATDSEVYGVEEYWTFPSAHGTHVQGDCEDYVVLKRKLLMSRGWPASALLITVVLDENGDGHAVLTARTAQGDFVLDNKVREVKLWSQTPYRFVMRQSYINPKVWMSLDPRATVTPQALAGLKTN